MIAYQRSVCSSPLTASSTEKTRYKNTIMVRSDTPARINSRATVFIFQSPLRGFLNGGMSASADLRFDRDNLGRMHRRKQAVELFFHDQQLLLDHGRTDHFTGLGVFGLRLLELFLHIA